MNLFGYGIFQEQSDYRVHVCFMDGGIYIYKTIDGVAACQSGKFQKRLGYQKGIAAPTAEGYIVPPNQISGCRRVEIPENILGALNCQVTDSTSEKGNKGVQVVRQMLLAGLIPLELTSHEITDRDLQIKGLDIIVSCAAKLQVKTDYRGGALGETGNLYLQIAERNPFNCH